MQSGIPASSANGAPALEPVGAGDRALARSCAETRPARTTCVTPLAGGRMRAEDTVAISSLFRRTGSLVPVVMLLAGSLVAPAWARAQAPAAPPQSPAAGAAPAQAGGMATLPPDEEIERFLKDAKIVSRRGAGKGVTNS